jgi:hypothetical protein
MRRVTWRCFPWDANAAAGEPFSSTYLVPGQMVGRFDLADRPPVRYLAESPEHAIGEVLSPFRGTTFRPTYLRQSGHALALVEVVLSASLVQRIPDCTDPGTLATLGIRPDALAHHDRTLTQAIARRLHALGLDTSSPAGLRWWSGLTGAWHTNVIFSDRVKRGDIRFGTPRTLRTDDAELVRALSILGIRMHSS